MKKIGSKVIWVLRSTATLLFITESGGAFRKDTKKKQAVRS